MLPFRLRLPSESSGSALEFEAASASAALVLAERHGTGRPAELWRGDQLVCRLAEASGGFWEIC